MSIVRGPPRMAPWMYEPPRSPTQASASRASRASRGVPVPTWTSVRFASSAPAPSTSKISLLLIFNQFGDLERCMLRPGNVHSAEDWRSVLEPVVARYRERGLDLYFRGDAAFSNPEIYDLLERRASAMPSGCWPTGSCRSGSLTC